MKPSRIHLIAALTASLGCASLSAQHVLGYGFGFDAKGREVVVEMEAGAVNAVRSSTVLSGPGVGYITDIVWEYDMGQLFGVAALTRDLFEINPTTGVTSLVNSNTLGVPFSGGLAADFPEYGGGLAWIGDDGGNVSIDQYGGASASFGSLSYADGTVDPSTGKLADVNPSGLLIDYPAGDFYFIDYNLDTLGWMDAFTGASYTRGPLGFDAYADSGFAFGAGTGWLVQDDIDYSGGSDIFAIDLASGAGTRVGGLADYAIIAFDVKAVIPEPSTLLPHALAIGLAFFFVGRRRRR